MLTSFELKIESGKLKVSSRHCALDSQSQKPSPLLRERMSEGQMKVNGHSEHSEESLKLSLSRHCVLDPQSQERGINNSISPAERCRERDSEGLSRRETWRATSC